MIRHIAFDLDGTVYRGKEVFSWTPKTFELLEKHGIGYTYLTNNSSLAAKDYYHKLIKLGFKASPENIYTSSLATIDLIKKAYSHVKTLFVLGTPSLRSEFADFGYTVLEYSDNREPDMVVVGFDMTLQYEPLCKTAYWIQQGKPYLATHPDDICPTDLPTVLVDCGALCACIRQATGRSPDHIPGKPNKMMIEEILQKHRLLPHELVMVGDRLYTDIAMAQAAGVVGILVLSGEATRDDLRKSEFQPRFVYDDIFEMVQDILKRQ